MSYYKINDSLYLVREQVSANYVQSTIKPNVNHILVIDCSGSMDYSLPRMREQLKRKIPKMLAEGDTLSVVWFSGRNQYGTLLEAEPVSTLADLSDVEKAIDRWLRPVGMTGFKEPLEEVTKLVTRVTKKNSNPFALFFMSDGQDNQWSKADILSAVESASAKVSATTIVEYGYYADRNMLAAMAEKAGGSLIFAVDFDQYAPQLESAITKKVSAEKVEARIGGDVIGGFTFTLGEGEVATYTVENNRIRLGKNNELFCYLSPVPVGQENPAKPLAEMYAAVSLFSIRGKSDIVWALLKNLGDVTFIDSYSNCFGKQKYTEFMESSQLAAFDESARMTNGYDPNKVPKDDAFTVLDLLALLQKDDQTRLFLDDPNFKYARIGRSRVDSVTVLSAGEQTKVNELTIKMVNESDPKIVSELAEQISKISSKPDALKFELKPATEGYSINGLVYAEERPNISIRVRKVGSVDLTSRLPAEYAGDKIGKVPAHFNTFVYRNYAIVKDGLTNVAWLPLKASKETFDKIRREMKPYEVVGLPDCFHVNVAALPIVNRKMVNEVSAKALFENQYQLLKTQAKFKVFNSIKKELFPEAVGEAFEALYGHDAAVWLKEQGITETGGFNPRSVQATATDFYMAKELLASIKGFSSLPSLKDARDRIKSGKMTPAAALMAPTITEIEKKLAVVSLENFNSVLELAIADTQSKVRALIRDLAMTKFAIVVGQVWPKEFASVNDNTLKVTVDGTSLDCKLEMKETKVMV